MHFALEACCGKARAGVLHTRKGLIQTPVFMPVGTQAAIKAATPHEVWVSGSRILLGNTYHLHLRPGEERIKALGGLHHFMQWPGAILTDSGGYQLVSLKALTKVTEQGATFKSHHDGSMHLFTPEAALKIQNALGSDIMMCLDHPLALPANEEALSDATLRTIRWAQRCAASHQQNKDRGQATGALFGIVQGGLHQSLRQQCASSLQEIGFDGYAIGGVSVGENREQLYEAVNITVPMLPSNAPRYLMGVGEPQEMLHAIGQGVDMFDCVIPTRNARNGTLYTQQGRLNIKNARFRDDPNPLESDCPCPTCTHFSRAYLHHLFRAKEILSLRLNTLHNLYYMQRLMAHARQAILNKTF